MRAFLPTLLFAVLLLPPEGWHFTRTGQERVNSADGKTFELKLVRGDWSVATPRAQTLRYSLFLCREIGSRVCSQVRGEVIGEGWQRATVRAPGK